MRKEYILTDQAAKKHISYFGKLLLASGAAVILSVILGLPRWQLAHYVWVNILLLGVLVFCVNALAHFGGFLEGKENAQELKKKLLIGSAIAAGVVWLILTIMGSPVFVSTFIFIANVILSVVLVKRFWEMLKNVWKGLSGEVDKNGKDVAYAGEIILHDVHTSDSYTSSFGKILIYENALLFVLPEMNQGAVVVNPNGTMTLKKVAWYNDERLKENNLSVSDIMAQAKDGATRMIRLLEEQCKKRNIEVPQMVYDYVLYLPNFERGNVAWDIDSFSQLRSVHFWNVERKYDTDLQNAAKADYFNGRACYEADDLQKTLEVMNSESGILDTNTRSKAELVAQLLSEAYELQLRAQ